MKETFQQAGSLIGGPVGGQLGGLFNRALYALTGFGDYKVQSNALLEETNGPLRLSIEATKSSLCAIVNTLRIFIRLPVPPTHLPRLEI